MYSAKKEWNKFLLETKISSLLKERKVTKWEEMKTILALAVKAEELKADDDKVKSLIEEMATAYEDPSEVIKVSSSIRQIPQPSPW